MGLVARMERIKGSDVATILYSTVFVWVLFSKFMRSFIRKFGKFFLFVSWFY